MLHEPNKFQLPQHSTKSQFIDKINVQSTNDTKDFDNTEEEILFHHNDTELFKNNDIDIQNIFNEDQTIKEDETSD